MSSSYTVHAPAVRCQLGEGVMYSDREHAVYWVDIIGQALHRLALADGAVNTWRMPERVGWVIERSRTPGLIAGLQSGLHALQLDPFELQRLVDPEPELPGNRLNDAKADDHGRIWAGTMDAAEKVVTGSLYRFDPDLRFHKMDGGYFITNGPAFSPAHDALYHTDSARGVVWRFDLSASGELSNKRPFITISKDAGSPDGMTVDAEGCLWIAHHGGGRVSRFSPQGELERAIRLPVSQITNCTFGGESLDRMFITSAARDAADDPLAGRLFEVDPGVRGLPPNRFGG